MCQKAMIFNRRTVSHKKITVNQYLDLRKRRLSRRGIFLLNCTRFSKKKRIVISLILFRCAKRFILPQKTKTSEKRVRSFQSQNSTAQSHKIQHLYAFFFLYHSLLTIQHKVLFQRLLGFDNKQQISDFCWKEKGILQKIMRVNQRKNSP